MRAEYADKELLLKTSDFVSIHVPLTRETRPLIGYKELCTMKPSAYIINTARGEIIHEEALGWGKPLRRNASQGLPLTFLSMSRTYTLPLQKWIM